MLVAATVTSGCHTADVASDSGSGGNTSLTNGALDTRHGYAALSLASSGLTFCILLSCSRPRLMFSDKGVRKKKKKFMLFSDHNGSLPRRQPGARTRVSLLYTHQT